MLKVMIVDDDINVIDCLSALIPWDQIGGTLVASAENGREGYNLAIEHAPDIIICDIVMPVMDGTELCRKIYETMSDVTFIFLSAYEDFTTAQLALKYHVRDYILKPIDRSKIDYIISLLKNIGLRDAKKQFYMRLLHDYDMEERINQALSDGAVSFFAQLFRRLTTDIIDSNLDIWCTRDVVYRLLNLLFGWMRRSGLDPEAERAETFASLDQLKFKMDLVFFASEQFFQHMPSGNQTPSTYYDALTRQVAAYIDENFTNPLLTVSSVALHFNYSSDYLGRLFSQSLGQTVSAYIIQKRMEHAAALLVDGVTPVNDIAQATGYLSPNYFARAFRKYYNMSPSDYRAHFSRDMRR